MLLKKFFLMTAMAAMLLCGAGVAVPMAVAQNQMSDVQVLDYLKSGIEQGKSQNQLIAELAARGVDRAQAERVKALYESQQTGIKQAQSTAVSENRSHAVNGEVDLNPREFVQVL